MTITDLHSGDSINITPSLGYLHVLERLVTLFLGTPDEYQHMVESLTQHVVDGHRGPYAVDGLVVGID